MTKRIKFEGQIHSFPDDATDEEINQALGGQAQQQPSILSNIMNEANAALHMPLGRSLKNIGQGALDLAEFGTNPAGPAMKYLASKDIPYISKLAKHWPQYPESDIFGLGEKQPGDVLFQAATPLGTGFKGAQLASKPLSELAMKAFSNAPKIAEKGGDLFPILKKITANPYKKQIKILEEKGLMTGYKPNVSDVLSASDILKSKGMKIPHAAVDEAVAQTLEGNYKPWFDLQSSVRSEGRRLSKMGGVHSTLGEKLHKLAEKMHTEIGEPQAARGAPEAERLMHKGKERTARYYKISPASKIASVAAVASMSPKWIAQMIRALTK
jgi:hypothetical protein